MGCSQSKTGAKALDNAEKRIGTQGFATFDMRLKNEWEHGDKDKSGTLDFQEVKKLLHKLNIDIPARELRKKFDKYDADKNNVLDFDEFRKLFEEVESLPNVETLFSAACGGDKVMVAEELQRLCASISCGKLLLSIADCVRFIMQHEGCSEQEIEETLKLDPADASASSADAEEIDEARFLESPLLSYRGFQRLLLDPVFNCAIDSAKRNTVYQDMTRPLSHYWISASHNTYLSGNQLNSESTGEAIGRALKLGVRVVELDAWDGPSIDHGPIVNHGHTLCKPTSFQSCIEAVKANAFTTSKYPVIITIENHCSVPFQKKQTEILKQVLGDLLYVWSGEGGDFTVGPKVWASPEELKGKIVIRDKPVKKHSKKEKSNVSEKDVELQLSQASGGASSVLDDAEDEEEEDAILGADPELLKLMYIKNTKLKPQINKETGHVSYPEVAWCSSSSLVEAKMIKLTKPGFATTDLARYAAKHLVRIYPAGGRVDSSNYLPTPAWNAGCQIVALNYQTSSLPVWLNQGRFSDNGGCGYVLKPDFLRPEGGSEAWGAMPTAMVCSLTVTILSAHYLPKPAGKSDKSEVIDPFVEVSVHGVVADESKKTTKVIDNNGFNPTWNQSFSFSLNAPEVALISFVIKDKDLNSDDLISQSVLPVCALVPGYKVVPLFYGNGAPQEAALFVKIEFAPSPPRASTDP